MVLLIMLLEPYSSAIILLFELEHIILGMSAIYHIRNKLKWRYLLPKMLV